MEMAALIFESKELYTQERGEIAVTTAPHYTDDFPVTN